MNISLAKNILFGKYVSLKSSTTCENLFQSINKTHSWNNNVTVVPFLKACIKTRSEEDQYFNQFKLWSSNETINFKMGWLYSWIVFKLTSQRMERHEKNYDSHKKPFQSPNGQARYIIIMSASCISDTVIGPHSDSVYSDYGNYSHSS